jgi:hypothetical protein
MVLTKIFVAWCGNLIIRKADAKYPRTGRILLVLTFHTGSRVRNRTVVEDHLSSRGLVTAEKKYGN